MDARSQLGAPIFASPSASSLVYDTPKGVALSLLVPLSHAFVSAYRAGSATVRRHLSMSLPCGWSLASSSEARGGLRRRAHVCRPRPPPHARASADVCAFLRPFARGRPPFSRASACRPRAVGVAAAQKCARPHAGRVAARASARLRAHARAPGRAHPVARSSSCSRAHRLLIVARSCACASNIESDARARRERAPTRL